MSDMYYQNQKNTGNYGVPPVNPNINDYRPPQYVPMQNYDNIGFNFPNNFSQPSQSTQQVISVDNRISMFSQYLTILYTLFVFSILGFLGSIFAINSLDLEVNDRYRREYHNLYILEVINFFVNLLHVGGYFYGIQAFTKQKSEMNGYFEYVLTGFIACNFFYFILYIFLYHVYFLTWCVDIFFLIINGLLYYQAKEITLLFKEKERLKRLFDTNF